MIEEGKELGETQAFTMIQKYWAPRIVDQVKSIRTRKDNTGVIFDIDAKSAETFLDSYQNFKEKNKSRADFEVSICVKLPELGEESGMIHEATFNAQGGYGELKDYADKKAGGEGEDQDDQY